MAFDIGSVHFSKDRTVIIAEAGVNHLGRMDYAENLVAAAKAGGADIVKFQTYKAHKLTTKSAPRFWNWEGERNADGSQYDSYAILDSFGAEQYAQLMRICAEYGIEFLSTPFDPESADMLVRLGLKGFKVASCDVTNIPFLEFLAAKQLPILLSTGASTLDETARAVEAITGQGNSNICVMHCTLCYPTAPQDANLPRIHVLQQRFPDYLIGFSDHTLGTVIAASSVLYGVRAIEKHFTFDKTLPDSADHWLSLDQADLARLVEDVRTLEQAIAPHAADVLACEDATRKYARRSIVAARDLRAGDVVRKEDVAFKRPGTGISPAQLNLVVGKRLVADVPADHLFAEHELQTP